MKKLLSVLLALILVIGCVPFSGIVFAEESAKNDIEHVIFKVNPSLFGAGKDATATSASASYFKSHTNVMVKEEAGQNYYSATEQFDGIVSQYNRPIYFKSGYTNNNLGWLADLKTINALVGLMNVNVEYRITTENFEQEKLHFMLGTAQAYTPNNQYTTYDATTKKSPALIDVWTESWGDWTTVSATPTAVHSAHMYSGFIGFKTEPANNEECTITTDIRNVTFTIKESNRDAINDALAAAGSTWTFDTLIDYFFVDTEYIIFKTNPISIGDGGDATAVSASSSYFTSYSQVLVEEENDRLHYTSVEELDGVVSQYNRPKYFSSGYTNNNIGWLADLKTINALVGLMNVNVEYRITTENFEQEKLHFMLGTAQAYTAKNHYTTYDATTKKSPALIDVWTESWGDWTTVSATPTAVHSAHMYSGFIGFKTEPANNEECTIKTDIRKVTFTISERKRRLINEALAAAGSTWTFDKLIEYFYEENNNPYADDISNDVIWYANPDKLATGSGVDVTLPMNSDEGVGVPFYDTNKTIKMSDEDGSYYRTSMEVYGSGGNTEMTTTRFASGITKDTTGYGWLANTDVLNALAPYMYFSVETRFDGTKPTGGTNSIIINGITSKDYLFRSYTTITSVNRWMITEFSPINIAKPAPGYAPGGTTFNSDWGDGAVGLAVYSYNSADGFNGTMTIDVRNLRMQFMGKDRAAINSALAKVEGIDNIVNFTEGVSLGLDLAGNKDYYSLFTAPPKGSAFDINDDNEVSILDLIRTKKYVADSIYVPEMFVERADADGDGFVDSIDLIELRKHLLFS